MFNENDQMRGLLTTFGSPNAIFPYSPNLSQHHHREKKKGIEVHVILLVVKASY